MKKYFVFISMLFLLVLVSSYCFAMNPMEEQAHKGHHHGVAKDENLELSGKIENGIRIIEVRASRYKFAPDPIVVKLGEKVRLVVTSADVTHGLAISKFKINLSISPGRTESVEFAADKKGIYQVYCSVYCGPGHGHMHADLIVK